jgi:hypothetical protein
MATDPERTEAERPTLRVVKGDATPEEIAALVAVLAGRSAPAEEAEPAPSAWIYRRAQLSKPVFVGPGEWRRSGFDQGTRTKADW